MQPTVRAQETIELYVSGVQWLARFSDPIVRRHFGSDTLPTPFMDTVPAATVRAEIKALNPGSTVVVVAHWAER